MKPQRRCIGCGRSFDKDQLIRVAFSENMPVVDERQSLPGRGCYICRSEECLQLAIKKKAFGRALKKDISDEALGRCFNDR